MYEAETDKMLLIFMCVIGFIIAVAILADQMGVPLQ